MIFAWSVFSEVGTVFQRTIGAFVKMFWRNCINAVGNRNAAGNGQILRKLQKVLLYVDPIQR